MKKIDLNIPTKYEQLYKVIKADVLNSYNENDKFLSENELADHFQVNRTTINKVICALVSENLLFRIQGKGTFVRKKPLTFGENSSNIKIQVVFAEPKVLSEEFNPVTWFISFDIFKGILEACAKYNINVTIANISESDDLKTKKRVLLDGKTKGFIFIQSSGYEEIIQDLKNKNYPLVIAHGSGDENNINSVVIDREKGAYDAVQYLIKLGHRRIGFLSGTLTSSYYRLKLTGYTKALADNGYSVENELIQECQDADFKELNFLNLKNKPTAIFACSAYRALKAMQAIKQRGLSIPEDIAVIGAEDSPDASISIPPLTTLQSPNYQSGLEALKLLIEVMQNKALKNKQVFLPMKLIVRKTCGDKIWKADKTFLVNKKR